MKAYSRDFSSYNVRRAIEEAGIRVLKLVVSRAMRGYVSTLDDAMDLIVQFEKTEPSEIPLGLEDQFSLALCSEDYGRGLGEVTLNTLRDKIESLATWTLHQIGREQAEKHLHVIDQALKDHDLDLGRLLPTNHRASEIPSAQRDEGAFYVYEYRNLEGEPAHYEIWEFQDFGKSCLYFEVPISPEGVGSDENTFCSS